MMNLYFSRDSKKSTSVQFRTRGEDESGKGRLKGATPSNCKVVEAKFIKSVGFLLYNVALYYIDKGSLKT